MRIHSASPGGSWKWFFWSWSTSSRIISPDCNFETLKNRFETENSNLKPSLSFYQYLLSFPYGEIVRAIEKLDDKYCTTLQLFFCKEMTPNAIAELMGISPKTVYTRLARGKKLLLEILKGAKING